MSKLGVLNPLKERKPHPPWFAPFGRSPRALLYNGALYQMMVLGSLFGATGYLLGRKPPFTLVPEGDVEDTDKALQAFVKLPGTKKSGYEYKEASSRKKNQGTTFGDRWMMGAAPIASIYISSLLAFALGARQRKKQTKDKALDRYKVSQKQYDDVLEQKLYGTVKEARDKSWVFEKPTKGGAPGIGAAAAKGLYNTLGISPAIGLVGMFSLLTAFITGKSVGDKQSKQRKKMKDIRSYVKRRQMYRFMPKLVLPGESPYAKIDAVMQEEPVADVPEAIIPEEITEE